LESGKYSSALKSGSGLAYNKEIIKEGGEPRKAKKNNLNQESGIVVTRFKLNPAYHEKEVAEKRSVRQSKELAQRVFR